MPPGTYQTREWGNVFRHVPHRFIPARVLEGLPTRRVQSRGDPSAGVSWQSVGSISPQKLCVPG